MKRALALSLAAFGLIGAAPAEPFRMAVQAAATTPCAAPGSEASAGEKAYYEHLAKRLGRPVQRCAFATEAEAAAALADGKVDLARLTPVSFPSVAAKVRATMTVRGKADANRIPIMIAVRKADTAVDVASLKGRAISFGGTSAANLAAPRAVLSERGLPETAYRSDIAHDGDAALADLRGGKAEVAAVHAAAWQRVCRMVSPKDPDPCADIRLLLRARPQAKVALAVRRDMPDTLRFQLIGIHMAMNLDNPTAFVAAAAGMAEDPAEFQPAEAEALTLAALK